MPTLHLAYCPATVEPQAQALATTLTDLTANLLHKRADRTLVHLQRVAADDWFVDGQPLAALGLAGYRLRIDVSQGSNDAAQMAAYIAAVHAALADQLGDVHPVSYVLVQTPPALHWGWGGRTQAARAADAAATTAGRVGAGAR